MPSDDRMMLGVYIPTVPNPTSGMLAIVSEDEVTETAITVEEAMKVVFSGGIVLPEIINSLENRKMTPHPGTATAVTVSETRTLDES